MTPLWYGVGFIFVLGNIFSMMLEGSSGIASTRLNGAITAVTLTIPIDSANGFLSADTRVFIENEEMQYDSIQTTSGGGCAVAPCLILSGVEDRGLNGTDASAHADDIKVLSEAAGLLNQVVGFQVGEVDSVVGAIKAPFQMIFAVSKFAAKAVMWDYSFLEGNGVFIKYTVLYPLSLAFVVAMISLLREAFSGLFGR